MSPFIASFRQLRRQPILVAAIAATLALGVGAATALFVYLSAFFRPVIPAVDSSRLVQIQVGTEKEPAGSSFAEYRALATSPALEVTAANYGAAATVSFQGDNAFAWGQAVTSSFFRVFGGRALLGRLLLPADDVPGGTPPIVLSNRLWRGLLGADPRAVGRSVELNGRRFTVVGVLARGFQGTGYACEWFVPLAEIDHLSGVARLGDPHEKFLFVWGLVPRGAAGSIGIERAASTLAGVARGLDAEIPLPEGARRAVRLAPATLMGPDFREDPYYLAARALTAATLLFLLLGAGNVSGLLLARATARDGEWAVQKAMGASPWRLAAAVVGETLPLVGLGLLGATGVAFAILRRIEGMLLTPIGGLGSNWMVEDAHVLRLDGRALAFALLAASVTLALATLPPLARALRRSPARALGASGARSGIDRRTLAPRRLLVAFEMALAVVLTVGGVLLARTLRAYMTADPGFVTDRLVLMTVYLPPTSAGADRAVANAAFYRDLAARVAELPSVSGAAVTFVSPNSGLSPNRFKAAPVDRPDGGLEAETNIVGPGYFATLGVPLVAGRELAVSDRPDGPPVVVVSRRLATKLWGDAARALGRRLRVDLTVRPGQAGPDFEVVGVSADAGISDPAHPEQPWIFFVYGQRRSARMQLVLRSTEQLATLEPKLRAAVSALRAEASVVGLVSAEEQLARALGRERLNAQIAGGLALAGLATALVGLVALELFTVQLRRRDFAVHLALGATRRDLSRQVLGESLRLALWGGLFGLAAAAAAARLLQSLLYGVSPLDPWTFLGVPLLLAAAVLAASWWPARRASAVDPAENLRAL